MQSPELSIIMPCLNEAASLPSCLEKALAFLRDNNVDGEVIVADNGSIDNSAGIARSYQVLLVQEPQPGYGRAIMAGVKAAAGKFIIVGDADDSYDFYNLLPMLEQLRMGSDMVIGNRFKGGIQQGAMPFLHRYIGNPVLSFIGRLFFKIPVGDFHCGLRGFSHACFDRLGLRTVGMEFASEMIVKAALLKMSVTETPVVLSKDKRNRPSHLRTWRDGWRHLRFLLLYSPRWLFFIPGCVLLVLGLFGSAILVAGPVHLGRLRLDVHTLVYTSACILLGFQLVSFYVFSRVYLVTHHFLPAGKSVPKWPAFFNLERGIGLGIFLIAAGIFLNVKSILYWKRTGFGDISPELVLRWVIPSAIFILLGVQLIISCFYLSIISIKSKDAGDGPVL